MSRESRAKQTSPELTPEELLQKSLLDECSEIMRKIDAATGADALMFFKYQYEYFAFELMPHMTAQTQQNPVVLELQTYWHLLETIEVNSKKRLRASNTVLPTTVKVATAAVTLAYAQFQASHNSDDLPAQINQLLIRIHQLKTHVAQFLPTQAAPVEKEVFDHVTRRIKENIETDIRTAAMHASALLNKTIQQEDVKTEITASKKSYTDTIQALKNLVQDMALDPIKKEQLLLDIDWRDLLNQVNHAIQQLKALSIQTHEAKSVVTALIVELNQIRQTLRACLEII